MDETTLAFRHIAELGKGAARMQRDLAQAAGGVVRDLKAVAAGPLEVNEMLRRHGSETISIIDGIVKKSGKPEVIPGIVAGPSPREETDANPAGLYAGLKSIGGALQPDLAATLYLTPYPYIRMLPDVAAEPWRVITELRHIAKASGKTPVHIPGPAVPPGDIMPVFVTNWPGDNKRSEGVWEFLKDHVSDFIKTLSEHGKIIFKKLPEPLPELPAPELLPFLEGSLKHNTLFAEADHAWALLSNHLSAQPAYAEAAPPPTGNDRPINIWIDVHGDRVITRTDDMHQRITTTLKRGYH